MCISVLERDDRDEESRKLVKRKGDKTIGFQIRNTPSLAA